MQRPERRAEKRGPARAGFFPASSAPKCQQYAQEQGGIDEMQNDVRAQEWRWRCRPVARVDQERELRERPADRIAEPRREVVDDRTEVVDSTEVTERGKIDVVV